MKNELTQNELLAQTVTEYSLYISSIFFGTVLILMILNKRRNNPRPKLDWSFIVEKYALFQIVVYSALVLNQFITPTWYIRVYLWTFLGITEIFVLWFIYLERFGKGSFTRTIKRAASYVHKTVKRVWSGKHDSPNGRVPLHRRFQ